MSNQRRLEYVIERMSRAMCGTQNECSPQDGYCDIHWIDFAPAARAAYDELIRIDGEPMQVKPRLEPEVMKAKKKKSIERLLFPVVSTCNVNLII